MGKAEIVEVKNQSLRKKLICLLAIGVALTFAALIADHVISDNLVRRETVYQYQNLLDERVRRLDDALHSEAVSMVLFANNNTNISSLKRAEDETNTYFSGLRAKKDMDVLALSSLSDAAFFFRGGDETTYCGISRYSSLSAFESRDLEKFIKDATASEMNTGNKWKLVRVGESWFFLYSFCQQDCAFGLCLEAGNLLKSLGLETGEQSALLLLTDEELAIADSPDFSTKDFENLPGILGGQSGVDRKDLLVSSYAQNLERPIYYIRKKAFSDNMEMGIFLLRITTFVIALIFFLYSVSSYYSIYRPLERLKSRISAVRDGQMQTTIEIRPETPREFAETYQLFNEMTSEIKSLKISSYEAELEKREYEKQFLSMQIEPHFYLNSMKYLYALAQRKQFGMIQEILILLSNYFRYLTYDSQKLVELADEIQHAEDYLSIVTAGVQSKIKISLSVMPEAESALVPKLFVQTFVENAVKYAVRDDGSLTADISVNVIGTDDAYLTMVIRDNGKGFSPEYIRLIEENGFAVSNEHIGLSNLYHRLLLIYGQEIYMNIQNQDEGGALIEVMVPVIHNAADAAGGREAERPYEYPDRG